MVITVSNRVQQVIACARNALRISFWDRQRVSYKGCSRFWCVWEFNLMVQKWTHFIVYLLSEHDAKSRIKSACLLFCHTDIRFGVLYVGALTQPNLLPGPYPLRLLVLGTYKRYKHILIMSQYVYKLIKFGSLQTKFGICSPFYQAHEQKNVKTWSLSASGITFGSKNTLISHYELYPCVHTGSMNALRSRITSWMTTWRRGTVAVESQCERDENIKRSGRVQ